MASFLITGTSKGIGQGLALAALEAGYSVVGVARSSGAINHSAYQHITQDLVTASERDLEGLVHILPSEGTVVLVNNAATLGPVLPLGRTRVDEMEAAIRLNVAVPALLMKAFISRYARHRAQATVLNISSGVAQYPVQGWSTYCSSKAALEMMTQVAAKESEAEGQGIRFLAVAPGVVDTPMQEHIRSQKTEDFSSVARFQEMHRNGDLTDPKAVARKLLSLVEEPTKYPDWRYDVRQLG